MRWQEMLHQSFTRAEDLTALLEMTPEEEKRMEEILELYPMSIPSYYLSLVDLSDPEDPIRKMCIPSVYETDLDGAFDTSGEASNTVMPGLQHKYLQTALVLSTSNCAMYCRHCFRRRLVGLSDDEVGKNIDAMVDYIRDHEEITNVLISGGDSFMNSNETIERYLKSLCDVEHLDLIRFGTRIPVVLPMRITEDPELQSILAEYNRKKPIYVITQFNHPRECTPQAKEAIGLLLRMGIVVKNQTVLLKGVNDDPRVLGELLRNLTRMGVVPYYVFQCRPVTGVKNQFQVPLEQGVRIVDEAKNLQNGQGKCFRYAMAHETGKIEILGKGEDGRMLFKYQQAKDPADWSRIFTRKLEEGQCWLDDE
ncbi:KamA family radical SAM protein [Anaerotalea alkaliphila]|uniref:KamA family radical SAM protein n=1 Tax=Anaerotalea alkaliphila TaxID=2662126 RepID=A0A7X5KNC7_9FIRM|nr:KamA family radical SAM protein [Anaerotalea alkaliphila]NDL66632.1 KamA family radical SAM protein [Anaerotalea alkaliphila]